MAEPTVYWGVACRTCCERIAFGIRGDSELGDAMSFLKPGAFQCVHGHKHTYWLDDVIYFEDNSTVTEAGIRRNRASYHLIDQPDRASLS